MPPWAVSLLAAGGLAYTVGALVYARCWPDPSPRIFGYHELFHVFVVVGTALHFSLIAIAVL
jgi:hemolysin III